MHFTTTNPEVLSPEQLQRIAPAVFASGAAPTTSKRYAFVSTSEVVAVLGRQGFQPVSAQVMRVRKPERQGFQSHVIRFRRADDVKALMVGDSIFEIFCKTAHDGSSAFEFSAGLYRLLRKNGLVAPAGQFGGFSVKHVGYAAGDVTLGIESMLDSLPELDGAVKRMQDVQLEPVEQRLFAESASRLRWTEQVPVEPAQLLRPKRIGDAGSSVWSVFNVIQLCGAAHNWIYVELISMWRASRWRV